MSGPITGDMPAFPVGVPGCGDNGWHGMSLRDWFAGQALTGLLATAEGGGSYWKLVAEESYLMADAMLQTRAAAINERDRVATSLTADQAQERG